MVVETMPLANLTLNIFLLGVIIQLIRKNGDVETRLRAIEKELLKITYVKVRR